MEAMLLRREQAALVEVPRGAAHRIAEAVLRVELEGNLGVLERGDGHLAKVSEGERR